MPTDRRTAAAASAAVVLGLWILPTGSASAGPAAAHQAWTRTRAAVLFVPTEGNLYVATTAGSEDARAFVAFEDVGDPTTLTLVLQESTETAALAAPERATITACALGSPLRASGEIAASPSAECRAQATATRGADGSWRVPLAPFRSFWAQVDHAGLALFPGPAAAGAPLQVPGEAATWRVAWVAAETRIATTSLDEGAAPRTTMATSVPAGGRAPPARATLDVANSAVDRAGAPADPVAAPGTAASAGAVPRAGAPRSLQPDLADAGHPSAAAAIALVAIVGLLTLPVAARAKPEVIAALAPGRWGGDPATGRRLLVVAATAFAAVAPLGASEATIFKLGLVALLAVTALGLHVLVNWAGELSLAHAAFAGLPAFAVAKLSADHDISAVHLLPVGIVVGAALGAVVGLPSLRARGIQVAVVTLAAGIAVDRFFFTKSWLVGPAQGVTIADTTLGPLRLETQRSLWLFLVACVVLAAVVVRAMHRSSVGRAWRWLRAEPAAAAAFGIPVARYKVAAYAVAGAFAGFGGGLTVVWVERVTAQSFPTSMSFTYLIVVVLAGRGLVGGVLAAAAILEGGRQFASGFAGWIDYVGPLALVVVLTRYRAGLTGIGGSLMRIVKDSKYAATVATRDRDGTHADEHLVTSSMVVGCVLVGLGFGAIALAWYHIGNTDQLWIHSQELVSGGLGGMAAVIVGAALLIRDQLIRNRVVVIERVMPTTATAVAATAVTNGDRPSRPLRASEEPSR